MLSPSCPVPLMVSPGIQIRTSLRIFRVFLESITSSTGITQRFSLPSLLYPTYLDQEVSGVLLVPNTPQTTFSCKIYSFETHSCHSYHPYWRHLLSVPLIHWRWFTSKMLSVSLPMLFSAAHPVSWSQILGWLSSDRLSLPLPHHPLMVTLILVCVRKCITSKICFLKPPLPTIFCLLSLLSQSLPLPHFFDLLRSLIPQTHHFFSISTSFLLVSPLYSSKFDSILYQDSQSFKSTTNSFAFSLYWNYLGQVPVCTLTLHLRLPARKWLNVTGEAQNRALKWEQTSYPALSPAQKRCSASSFWKLFHTYSLQLPSYSPLISILKNRSYQMKIPSSYFQTHNPV